jgi:hypothetical protein
LLFCIGKAIGPKERAIECFIFLVIVEYALLPKVHAYTLIFISFIYLILLGTLCRALSIFGFRLYLWSFFLNKMDTVRQLDLPRGHEVGLGHPRLTSSSHLGVKKYTDLKNYNEERAVVTL